jgi:hypothetical protein
MAPPDGSDPGDGREKADESGRPGEPDRRPHDRRQSRLPRWFDRSSKSIQWLVRAVVAAGAVAAAISAIVALWHHSDSPAKLSAKLRHVKIDTQVTLDDFASHHETETAWSPNSSKWLLLAADVVAQTPTENGTTGTEGTTTEGTTTEGTTGTEGTTTEGTTTEGTTTEGDGDIVQGVPVSDEDRQHLNHGLDIALNNPNPAVSQTDVGAACDDDLTDPDCGLRSTVTYLLSPHSPVTAMTVAGQMVTLFAGLRKQPPPPTDREPLGVTVNFNVTLTGFRGDSADVRWSLYAEDGGSVPEEWARNQHVLTLKPRAQQDVESPDFWIPLPPPRSRGRRFFVRVGVYDEDGTPRAEKDTEPFR